MNVFLLHEDEDEAAAALCDKHVSKMTLEAVQILNTGLHHADLSYVAFYGATHANHPWCKFVATSFDHFNFVHRHAQALGREFLRRYDEHHKSHQKMRQHWRWDDLRAIEQALGRADWETVYDDLPQTMLDEYKQDDPIEAYRAYYKGEKWPQDWCKYERADCPAWFLDSPKGRWKDLSR